MRRLVQSSFTLSCTPHRTKQEQGHCRKLTRSAQSWPAVSRGRALSNGTCTRKKACTSLPAGCGWATHPHQQLPLSRATQVGLWTQKQTEAGVAAAASSAAGWTMTCLCSKALSAALKASSAHRDSSSMVIGLTMIVSMSTLRGAEET